MSFFDSPKKEVISGHSMTYYRKGHGETIIFVHGLTAYSFIWRNIVDYFTPFYDVITIDLIGCGDSDKPLEVSYSLKHHAQRIKIFTDQLGIGKFHFISHDIGGGIGQIFAVNYPEKLFDLTLINTIAYDFWPVQPISAIRTPIIRQLILAMVDTDVFKFMVQKGCYHSEKVNDQLMAFFIKPFKTREGRKAFLHLAKCLDNRELISIKKPLSQLNLPVLIIRGEADIYLSKSISLKLVEELRQPIYKPVATGGHYIQEDEPAVVCEYIESFLKRNNHVI